MEKRFLRHSKNQNKDKLDIRIQTMQLDYEQDLKDNKERMFSLREENRILREEVENFKESQKYISDLMINAQKAANKIINDAEIEASKKLYGAKEEEKTLKALIEKYQAKLLNIEMQTSALLHDIVETVSQVKQFQNTQEENKVYSNITRMLEPKNRAG